MAATFEARLQELVDKEELQLRLLEAEKEQQQLQKIEIEKSSQRVRKVRYECLVLKQKIAATDCQMHECEDELEEATKKLQILAQRHRDVDAKIETIKDVRAEKLAFYQSKRTEMRYFHTRVLKFRSDRQQEVGEMENIAKDKIDEPNADGLACKVTDSRQPEGVIIDEQHQGQDKLLPVLNQKRQEIRCLQRECESLEGNVLQALRRRDMLRKELECLRRQKGPPNIRQQSTEER